MRGRARRGRSSCWSTVSANSPVATSTSATSSRAPGWTPGRTTIAGTAAPAGAAGDIERWSQFHDDLAERLAAIRGGAGGRPVVLYGHSMGGLVVAGYLLTDRPKPDLAVLGSPGLDSALPAWKKSVSRLLARITPTLPIPNGIDGSTLSRDATVGEKAGADARNATSSTARFGAAGLAEQARVRAGAAAGFGVPTLVLHGLDDGLVPSSASEVLEGAPGVERRTFPGLRHELHNEPEGPEIIEDVIGWLRAHVPGVGHRGTVQ